MLTVLFASTNFICKAKTAISTNIFHHNCLTERRLDCFVYLLRHRCSFPFFSIARLLCFFSSPVKIEIQLSVNFHNSSVLSGTIFIIAVLESCQNSISTKLKVVYSILPIAISSRESDFYTRKQTKNLEPHKRCMQVL